MSCMRREREMIRGDQLLLQTTGKSREKESAFLRGFTRNGRFRSNTYQSSALLLLGGAPSGQGIAVAIVLIEIPALICGHCGRTIWWLVLDFFDFFVFSSNFHTKREGGISLLSVKKVQVRRTLKSLGGRFWRKKINEKFGRAGFIKCCKFCEILSFKQNSFPLIIKQEPISISRTKWGWVFFLWGGLNFW